MKETHAMTYDDAEQAVTRSISHDERARLNALEDIPGWQERSAATVESLRAFGLEDWTRENDEGIDAWGTYEGKAWRVLIVDGLNP